MIKSFNTPYPNYSNKTWVEGIDSWISELGDFLVLGDVRFRVLAHFFLPRGGGELGHGGPRRDTGWRRRRIYRKRSGMLLHGRGEAVQDAEIRRPSSPFDSLTACKNRRVLIVGGHCQPTWSARGLGAQLHRRHARGPNCRASRRATGALSL
jgi:hypothetical protein